jgi:hypothetical protein
MLRFILLLVFIAGLVGCLRDRFIPVRPDQPMVPPIDPTPTQMPSDQEMK